MRSQNWVFMEVAVIGFITIQDGGKETGVRNSGKSRCIVIIEGRYFVSRSSQRGSKSARMMSA
jgi:hypothetical protein